MITKFVAEGIVMFLAGWVLSQRRYDKHLAAKTEEVKVLTQALRKNNELMVEMNAAINGPD